MRLLKIILKTVYKGILGAAALAAVNMIGGFAGFNVALNVFTALIAGFLGIPGIILIILVRNMFK